MTPGIIPPHMNGKLLNILETVEIPTPKPYIFLFLELREIKWYAGHNPLGQPHPQERDIAEYLGNC
jgi:hypothetical protein